MLQRRLVGEAGIAWAVLFGTIPVGLVGLAAHDFIAGNLRSAAVIAITPVVCGVLLWWADARGNKLPVVGNKPAKASKAGAAPPMPSAPAAAPSGAAEALAKGSRCGLRCGNKGNRL